MLEQLNKDIFFFINNFATKADWSDKLGIISAEYMPYLFILVEVLLYFVFKKKNLAVFAFFTMVLAIGFNHLIGFFYEHNRPFMDGIGHNLYSHKAENSFPSDHSTFLFAIACFLFISLKNKFAGFTLIFLALIGSFARVFIGVHYPFDVFGSIVVSIISSGFIFALKAKLQPINNFVFKIENKIFPSKTKNS